MLLRICASDCLELMGQILASFNIRYANSIYPVLQPSAQTKTVQKLTYSKTSKGRRAFN